jgi:hypothetical protein
MKRSIAVLIFAGGGAVAWGPAALVFLGAPGETAVLRFVATGGRA